MRVPRVSLVTGATGFVGSQIVRRLLREGFVVRALTSGTDRGRLMDVGNSVEWFPFTEPGVAQASQGVTDFFNFSVLYDRPMYSSETMHEVNVAMPLRIIDALESSGGQVNCVFGDTFYRKFSPDATAQSRYTKSKNLLAKRLSAFPNGHSCRFAMLLIEQVYGPGENINKVYPRVTRQLLEQSLRVPLTLGDQRRDFIHISDVVEAALVAARSEWEGVVEVGCGSGTSTPVKTVFELLKTLSGSTSELGFGDIPADQSIPNSTADITWLSLRGWRCLIPLEAGLKDFLEDVKCRCNLSGNVL